MDLAGQRFSIIDIETTGGISKRDKITEIAIIVYQNGNIIETYESLINPERSIPYEITRMTGITNEMVEGAPKFFEIAKEILNKTENCIFVAHNVFFDYNFIKDEFHQLGYSFSRKKLCTVQLSRRYFKGLKSYSLGSLIEYFDIKVSVRHRAMEDTKATLFVFNKILELTNTQNYSLTEILKENKIPSNINKENILNLPERPGIYYMRDIKGQAVYIGKSKNIKERIFQHFNDITIKTKKMLSCVHSIDGVEYGNELMASLMEAKEIKSIQPEFNKALRKKTHAFLLTSKRNQQDFSTFSLKEAEWLDSTDEVINHYSTRAAGIEHLEYLLYKYNLCKKVNNLELNGSPCYSFQLGQCHGACIGKEDPETYNERHAQAFLEINKIFNESFYIIGDGRNINEKSIIIIENGYCKYLGFLDTDLVFNDIIEIKDLLEIYNGNVETNRIIEQYISKDKNYKKIVFN